LTGTVVRDGQVYYRVIATGQPGAPSLSSVENYTATAEITANGFVRNLLIEYTEESSGERIRLRREVTYGLVNETSVTAPQWYWERFSGDATPTP
jgi:hypothetical protein